MSIMIGSKPKNTSSENTPVADGGTLENKGASEAIKETAPKKRVKSNKEN